MISKIFLALLELDFGSKRTLPRRSAVAAVATTYNSTPSPPLSSSSSSSRLAAFSDDATAKKRRLWRRPCWQLHLPKTVQKCNSLVKAGHRSCQRPWKTSKDDESTMIIRLLLGSLPFQVQEAAAEIMQILIPFPLMLTDNAWLIYSQLFSQALIWLW